MKVAERWLTPQHACPYCEHVQEDDGETGDEWSCENCCRTYELGDC